MCSFDRRQPLPVISRVPLTCHSHEQPYSQALLLRKRTLLQIEFSHVDHFVDIEGEGGTLSSGEFSVVPGVESHFVRLCFFFYTSSCRADRESGSFWSGVAIGGVVFGVLGFVFAPQISEALLGEDQRLRLPRFLDEEDDDPEVTKQNLAEKIAQLNSAIDDVSSQLKTRESIDEEEVTA